MELSSDERVWLRVALANFSRTTGLLPSERESVLLLRDRLTAVTRDRGAAHRSAEVACMAAQLSLPTVSMDSDGHIELEMRQEDPPVIVVIGGNRSEMMHLCQRLSSVFLERLMRGQPASAARG